MVCDKSETANIIPICQVSYREARNGTKKYRLAVIIFFIGFFFTGCRAIQDYNDTLIETSLISEVPTLIGNLTGGVAGIPFLVISVPLAYLIYPETPPADIPENYPKESQIDPKSPKSLPHSENSQREDPKKKIMLSPMYGGSYLFGTILGTPFYPFALLFPRKKNAPA